MQQFLPVSDSSVPMISGSCGGLMAVRAVSIQGEAEGGGDDFHIATRRHVKDTCPKCPADPIGCPRQLRDALERVMAKICLCCTFLHTLPSFVLALIFFSISGQPFGLEYIRFPYVRDVRVVTVIICGAIRSGPEKAETRGESNGRSPFDQSGVGHLSGPMGEQIRATFPQ